MDEVRAIRKRTHIWPVIVAAAILALVIAFVLFMNRGGSSSSRWNGTMQWPVGAESDAAIG